jgi:YfiH family protein
MRSERVARDAFIEPAWPGTAGVHALVTTSTFGNLALHTGDTPADVRARRAALASHCRVDRLVWLDQVHGTTIVHADDVDPNAPAPTADGVWTSARRVACAVLTADCVPILVADRDEQVVGVAHGGWRGLVNGVIEALLDALPVPVARLTAWLGPAIGAARYEVGEDVADAIVACVGSEVAVHVLERRTGAKKKWLADLSAFAALRLEARGVRSVVRSPSCTFDDRRFYSYRRDKSIGRIASLVWRE